MFNFCGAVNGKVTYRDFGTLAEAITFGQANCESFDVEEVATGLRVYQESPKTRWL